MTIITLYGGIKVIVQESFGQVMDKLRDTHWPGHLTTGDGRRCFVARAWVIAVAEASPPKE